MIKLSIINSETLHYISLTVMQYEVQSKTYEVFVPKMFNLILSSLQTSMPVYTKYRNKGTN